MKKYLILFALFMVPVGFIRAETAPVFKGRVLPEKMSVEKAAESVTSHLDAIRQKTTGEQVEFSKHMKENAEARYETLVLRFTTLIERTQARINTLKAKGIDVTKAQTYLNTAEATLDAQKVKFAENSTTLTNPKISAKELKARMKAAQDEFKKVRQSLSLALFELKGKDADYIASQKKATVEAQ